MITNLSALVFATLLHEQTWKLMNLVDLTGLRVWVTADLLRLIFQTFDSAMIAADLRASFFMESDVGF